MPTRANTQPAFACYLPDAHTAAARPYGLFVLTLEGERYATIRLLRSNGSLMFEVADDGHGFDPAATGYGTGLQGIADRLAALGGVFEIRSTPGQGTTLLGSLPVAEAGS